MLRGLFQNWKQPVFYNFDFPLSKEKLFEIIQFAEASGFQVVAMVSDLGGGNRALYKQLNISHTNTWFKNPANDQNIFMFADVPHLMKLLGNHFVDQGFILNDREINKSVIEELIDVTSTSDLKITHKISKENLNVQGGGRQKVKLATKLFSHTIAMAITRCVTMGVLKQQHWIECAEFLKLGGREHGVPILISELEQNGPAALSEQLYIGDAILFVNDLDLRNACHKEAVSILQQQSGDCVLQVQYIAADDSDNSLEEDGLNFRFFHEEVCDSSTSGQVKGSQEIVNTPTAPRTPESNSVRRLSPSTHRHSTENIRSQIVLDNTDNGNITSTMTVTKQEKTSTPIAIQLHSSNNNILPDNITKFSTNLSNVDTSELVLLDNATNNIIHLEDFKKVDVCSTMESNFNCSANSLISDNLSSPMQTSTDVYLDSEILSTDIASNDSHSPKNLQTESTKWCNVAFNYESSIIEIEKMHEFSEKPHVYGSNESLSNAKGDQSLLNSDESGSSSPIHKQNRNYKQKKLKKKYFGVKTLQSIFNKHDGYSDVSTTASELGEETPQSPVERRSVSVKLVNSPPPVPLPKVEVLSKPKPSKIPIICPQFEEHVHSIISDIITKGQIDPMPILKPGKPPIAASKKYFPLHGQNLRVSKALRLCPNEDLNEVVGQDQRKEKLLARYVYNANSLNVDGVGDPDFGTPV